MSIGNDPYVIGAAVEPTQRWVRVKFGGETVASSTQALLHRQYITGLPTYYFPESDVRTELLSGTEAQDWREMMTLTVGERQAKAWKAAGPPGELAELDGYYSFDWYGMDGWFEEEEEVFVHARDPHKRVDTLVSTRHVRIELGGVVLADSKKLFLLYETNLPTRYYIPRADVQMELLEATEFKSQCPYKGIADYWSVKGAGDGGKNIVWSYPDPIPENPKLKELMCFFNEKVDVFVDGQLQDRPQTPWS
jgi:uncharacterized protein (DUF427 family)